MLKTRAKGLKWVAFGAAVGLVAIGAFIGYALPANSEEIPFNRSCRVFTEGVAEWEAQERKDIMSALRNGHVNHKDYVIFTYGPEVVDGEKVPEPIVAMSHLIPDNPNGISVVVMVAKMNGGPFPETAVISCYGHRESVPVVEGGQTTLMSLTPPQEASD